MLWSTESQLPKDMPVNPDTLHTRYETENYPIYKDFCSFFVSGVVGIRNFDRNKCHVHYSQYVSVSDEAFTQLTIENNWDRWISMALTDTWKDSEVPSKWTTSKDKRRSKQLDEDDDDSDDNGTPQARRYRGWSAQGIARYNQLFTEIKNERDKESYTEFDNYCLDEFQKEAEDQGDNKHKRKKREPDKPLPVAYHELWPTNNDQGVQDVTIRLPVGMENL
jgi:hypothetical protein